MIVALATCPKDFDLSKSLLGWMGELQSHYGAHRLLLIGSQYLAKEDLRQLADIGKRIGFSDVQVIQTKDDPIGWPMGPNAMFRASADWMAGRTNSHFLWLEPDCTPMVGGWLDILDSEYSRAGKSFMGYVWDKPFPHMTGCGVYPSTLRRINPFMVNGSHQPFDTIRPDITLRKIHRTRLIHHEWGDIPSNTPWTFPDDASIDRISKDAVLFHRCKDGSLIKRLRERSNMVSVSSAAVKVPVMDRVVKALLRGGSSYYHSGNLGDIMYALYAIRQHGGGDLWVGPKQNRTSPCSMPTTKEQYDLLVPLLEAQPYVHRTDFSQDYPSGKFTYDLNRFRDHWNTWGVRNRENIHNLCKMHFYTLGISHRFHDNEPWLSVPDPTFHGRIVVHRSDRYRSDDFPWKIMVDEYRKDMLFVGHPTEHRGFERSFGPIAYWKCRNFLDLAQVIAGGKAFIGNQSFPCSIALAYGATVLQEAWSPSADCMFKRSNFFTQHDDIAEFEKYL